MRFARSGGSPEHDVQPLLQIAPGVEACDHAPVEPALLYEVDGPQVRLRVARSGPFDQALDPDAHVDGVGVVDGEPDHLSVAQWCACPFVEALRGIPFRKLQDRQCGLHRLIVKPFHGEQSADHGGAVGADAFRPLLAVFPVPRLPRGFAGRVGLVRRILVGDRRRQEPVRAQSRVFVPDLQRAGPDPQVHGGADVLRVGDGIPVARPGDVAVGLHPPAVDPVRHLVRHRRQWNQQRPLLAFEHGKL